MAASIDLKRLFLRGIYLTATKDDEGLEDALSALALGSYNTTKSGKSISSTMAAGRKVEFEIPAAGRGLTAVEIGEMLSQLLDLLEESQSALISAGITSPTDAQLNDEMMDRLRPRRVVRSDFSGGAMDYYGFGAVTA